VELYHHAPPYDFTACTRATSSFTYRIAPVDAHIPVFLPTAPVQLLHVALQTTVIIRYGLFIYGLNILHLGEDVLRCVARLLPEGASSKRQQVMAHRDIQKRKKSANRVTYNTTVNTSRTFNIRS
jgi:hypothetical protein